VSGAVETRHAMARRTAPMEENDEQHGQDADGNPELS
jgi:hypothetical protein